MGTRQQRTDQKHTVMLTEWPPARHHDDVFVDSGGSETKYAQEDDDDGLSAPTGASTPTATDMEIDGTEDDLVRMELLLQLPKLYFRGGPRVFLTLSLTKHVQAKLRRKYILNENFDVVVPAILRLSHLDKYRCYLPFSQIEA
ncbi:hypothetical protein Plhal703r1_c56g0162421 [Plasmopara halstedii]